MERILAHLKGLWAALLPLYEVYSAAQSDGAITENEYASIGKALVFFIGVWLIPNLGYVREYAGKVFVGRDKLQQTVDEAAGKHEFVDSDNDGISDKVELEANDPARRWPPRDELNP